MKALFTAEAIFKGERSWTIQSVGRLLDIALGKAILGCFSARFIGTLRISLIL